MLAELAVLEDRAVMIPRLNACCRVDRHINMKFVKTIVLNFHLTCYKQAYKRFVSARPNATEKTRQRMNRLSTPKNQAKYLLYPQHRSTRSV